MAKLGERVITDKVRDYIRSIDMDNETLLEEGRRGLKVIVDLLEGHSPMADTQLDLEALGSLLRMFYEKLADVKIGVHLSDI